jgi:hypothetical protein
MAGEDICLSQAIRPGFGWAEKREAFQARRPPGRIKGLERATSTPQCGYCGVWNFLPGRDTVVPRLPLRLSLSRVHEPPTLCFSYRFATT